MIRLFFALFVMLLIGCGGDIPAPSPYCETHHCKESTEVLQRPTSFALELQVNDTAETLMVHLFTVDCAYLPGEDTAQYSTFCVDSLKFGNSDKLYHLPQTNKYGGYNYNGTYFSLGYGIKEDGYYLGAYAVIPVDDDNHVRFTLVDRENKKKPFDLDLSAYVNMYKVHGDTFDFKFPKRTVFGGYTRDTSFSEMDCALWSEDDPSGNCRKEYSYGCYEYSVKDEPRTDTTVYCVVGKGDTYENSNDIGFYMDTLVIPLSKLADSSACKSLQFYVDYYQWPLMHNEVVPCYRIELDSVPETLSISNLYSRRLMNEAVLDSVGERIYRWFENQPDSSIVYGHRYPWHAITRLADQGPDGEDDFTIYTIYRDLE